MVMKKFFLVVALLLGSFLAYTQNDPWLFQLGLDKQTDTTDVVRFNLSPNFDVAPFEHPNMPGVIVYPYYYTTTMTVRWETSSNIEVDPSSISLVDQSWYPLISIWQQIIYFPHEDTINGYSYATFNTSGIYYTYIQLNAYEVYPFVQFEFFNPDSNCVLLEVIDDDFQCDNNLPWWCSLLLFYNNNHSYLIPQGGYDVTNLCFEPDRYIDGQQQVLIGLCSTGEQEAFDDEQIVIYPSPADQYIYIDAKLKPYVFFEIYDSYGRLINSGRINSNRAINVSNMCSGNYVIRLFDEHRDNPSSMKKFVKF